MIIPLVLVPEGKPHSSEMNQNGYHLLMTVSLKHSTFKSNNVLLKNMEGFSPLKSILETKIKKVDKVELY